MAPPLQGRVALITGVSRRRGIGFAIAQRLIALGASVFVTHFQPHDAVQPWGADDLPELLSDLRHAAPAGVVVRDMHVDLADPDAARCVVDSAVGQLGHVDILVCNHALSGSDGTLAAVDASMLDEHWQVNARSTLLLTKHFAAQHDGRPGGRVVWMTSGQQLGPMGGSVAYAASKAVLAGLTPTVADELIEAGIALNTVNPGPVNTGYLDADTSGLDASSLDTLQDAFPLGRFGEPDDPAGLIAWLVSNDGGWVVGQVLNSEGGFRR